ncbi:MAG: sulfotransferase family protein [Acidimicrobiales bacterium]
MSAGQPPLPSFLIIGAERSATRWLRFNLDRHPQILAPPLDIGWFSDIEVMRTRGRRWYQSQFDSWAGEPVLGEASVGYLKPGSRVADVVDRIHRSIPDVRIVALLRDPIDRLESAVRQFVKRGRLPADVDVYDLICRNDPLAAELELIGAGLYATSLYPYLRIFRDQVLVVDYADVCTQPEKVYESVLRHIGASVDLAPPDVDQVLFSDRAVVDVAPLTEIQRQVLFSAFRVDVEELEVLLAKDLSAWDPGTPPVELAAEVDAVLQAVPLPRPAPEPGEVEPARPDLDADDPGS